MYYNLYSGEKITRINKRFNSPVCFIVGTTGTLTDDMIIKLSERLITNTDLQKLGISGLKIEGFKVNGFIQKNVHGGITPAAREMLDAWRTKIGDDQKAYQVLWDALGSVEMALHRNVLK